MFVFNFQGALTFLYISLLSVMGENIAARFRKDLFKSIISQDIEFFDTHKTGEIVNRYTCNLYVTTVVSLSRLISKF